MSLIFGIIAGVLFGTILGLTSLFNSKDKRSLGTFIFATFIMFLFNNIKAINISAAGAIGSLILGVFANKSWKNGVPNFMKSLQSETND